MSREHIKLANHVQAKILQNYERYLGLNDQFSSSSSSIRDNSFTKSNKNEVQYHQSHNKLPNIRPISTNHSMDDREEQFLVFEQDRSEQKSLNYMREEKYEKSSNIKPIHSMNKKEMDELTQSNTSFINRRHQADHDRNISNKYSDNLIFQRQLKRRDTYTTYSLGDKLDTFHDSFFTDMIDNNSQESTVNSAHNNQKDQYYSPSSTTCYQCEQQQKLLENEQYRLAALYDVNKKLIDDLKKSLTLTREYKHNNEILKRNNYEIRLHLDYHREYIDNLKRQIDLIKHKDNYSNSRQTSEKTNIINYDHSRQMRHEMQLYNKILAQKK